MQKVTILKDIKNTIQEINAATEVILFGSRARDTAKEDSDWDILILVHNTQEVSLVEEQVFRDALFSLELKYAQAFSVFAIAKDSWEDKYSASPFYQNI
jgi:predicted nucleotidyltransferase